MDRRSLQYTNTLGNQQRRGGLAGGSEGVRGRVVVGGELSPANHYKEIIFTAAPGNLLRPHKIQRTKETVPSAKCPFCCFTDSGEIL